MHYCLKLKKIKENLKLNTNQQNTNFDNLQNDLAYNEKNDKKEINQSHSSK